MRKSDLVLITGASGFLGGHLLDLMLNEGYERITTPDSSQYDLTKEADVAALYSHLRPQVVIHLAARVGGIGANRRYPGTYFYKNLMMGTLLMEYARRHSVEKFVSIGTICAYPKYTRVPFKEEDIWQGYPEETNAAYGLAKKMMLVQAQAYREEFGFNSIYLLPVNLYGPQDNFDPESSHVIPALIKKCFDAVESGDRSITCWGTGDATREFLYVRDAAEGILRAAERYNSPQPVNLGSGQEVTIRDLVYQIIGLLGTNIEVKWDSNYPDGQPRRCLDTSRAKEHFGFEAQTPLQQGLMETIEWYRDYRAKEEVISELHSQNRHLAGRIAGQAHNS